MKLKEKLLISIIGLSIICLIIVPVKSEAALQANGNGQTKATLPTWLLNVRKMEATGGTLGLSDTINSTNLLSTATKSNNLDIHMEKNTEYGAMAILSASAYGNQNKIKSGQTTTGNKSGVVINLNNEWVAAGELRSLPQFINANSKYKNSYLESSYVAKVGDAIGETEGWHSPTDKNKWINSNLSAGLVRATLGSIFSYNGAGASVNNISYPSYFGSSWYTRAVIVVGEGF